MVYPMMTKTRKAAALTFIMLAVVLSFTLISAFEADAAGRISYGIDVFANKLELVKSGKGGESLSFKADDFDKATGSDEIQSITLLKLPSEADGRLKLSGSPVMTNQIISREMLDKLSFEPSTDDTLESTFVFGLVSSSQPLAMVCRMNLIGDSGDGDKTTGAGENDSELSTFTEISCYSYLEKSEDNGEIMNYRITEYPEKGTLELISREKGYFCYTPVSGFTGKDSFVYVCVAEGGIESECKTINITVDKSMTDIRYCDMEKNIAELAAMKLAQDGILTGENVCGMSFFYPEKEVQRDEFVAMVMKAAGKNAEYSKNSETGFADDESIKASLRSYMEAAEKNGYINGTKTSEGTFFNPSASVTKADAAVIIYNILGLEPEGTAEVFANESEIPGYAKEALATLAVRGVIEGDYCDYSGKLTRKDAALLITAATGR